MRSQVILVALFTVANALPVEQQAKEDPAAKADLLGGLLGGGGNGGGGLLGGLLGGGNGGGLGGLLGSLPIVGPLLGGGNSGGGNAGVNTGGNQGGLLGGLPLVGGVLGGGNGGGQGGLLGGLPLVGGLLGGGNGGGQGGVLGGGLGGGVGVGVGTTGGNPHVGGNGGGLLGGILGGGNGGLLGGLDLGNLLTSLDPTGLLGGSSNGVSNGIIGGLLSQLFGGGSRESGFIDPGKQGVPQGSVQPAKPQDGYVFTNVEVYSPGSNLISSIIQAVLGGKRSFFVTHSNNFGISRPGSMFTAASTSVQGICFANDITATANWVHAPCTFNLVGYVKGNSVGVLTPQVASVTDMVTTTEDKRTILRYAMKPAITKAHTTQLAQQFSVDEIRVTVAAVDPRVQIRSIVLNFALNAAS
ncbi:hypothetical protein DRE_03363 [Drechslerella stenobrocha 248]|uniref:Uncharacterized protein n=1 Tax=Drechslerella stenobrocha 248 TaxID=1043628 RepID=W7HUQ5_9PEZI|nr:hypothetical protein DRE_03363 [Drechslerella stenobrocha 248]